MLRLPEDDRWLSWSCWGEINPDRPGDWMMTSAPWSTRALAWSRKVSLWLSIYGRWHTGGKKDVTVFICIMDTVTVSLFHKVFIYIYYLVRVLGRLFSLYSLHKKKIKRRNGNCRTRLTVELLKNCFHFKGANRVRAKRPWITVLVRQIQSPQILRLWVGRSGRIPTQNMRYPTTQEIIGLVLDDLGMRLINQL